MGEMVERVARALQQAHYHRGRGIAPPWPKDRFEQEMWRVSARAAIEAMREPTEAMVAALSERYSHHNRGDEPYDGEARDYWQSMIDEALR